MVPEELLNCLRLLESKVNLFTFFQFSYLYYLSITYYLKIAHLGGVQLDYDRQGHMLYWLQSISGDSEDDENCTIYTMPYGGGNKVEFLGQDTGIVGSPSAIAFDWLGRNLFIANKAASNIEVVRVDGKVKFRNIVFVNDGTPTSIAKPKGLCLDPTEG